MANHLKMAEIHAILTLRARGWSFRRIARELGVHRETVARYVGRAAACTGADPPKPANAPTGPAPPKPANAPPGPLEGSSVSGLTPDALLVLPAAGRAGPPSGCEPYRSVILAKLDAGLSAVRIHQDLTAERGAALSYHAVRRFVGKLRSTSPLPFRRMECEPGHEAQVDFGTAAPVITSDGKPAAPVISPDGRPAAPAVKSKRRRTHLFRIVLSHSRKAYSEAVYRQTTDDFIRCLENAFWHFGGVPKTLVIDNLKAAVTKADWFDPDLNPKITAFCRHYGTVILPTKVRMPRHKGKVERGVGYAQDNALKGRTFDSLSEQNRFLAEWETRVADTRIHGTTRKQVGKRFAEVERPALLPLPLERFACFTEAQRKVNRDGHVEVAKSYYSAPPEFVGRHVWARWDGHVVRIFDKQLQQIAIHAQRDPGRFATDPQHIAAEKRGGIERGTAWWLRKSHAIGGDAGRWAESMLQQRGIPGLRVLMGLVSLTNKHAGTAIDQACRVAQSHGAYRLRDFNRSLSSDEFSSLSSSLASMW